MLFASVYFTVGMIVAVLYRGHLADIRDLYRANGVPASTERFVLAAIAAMLVFGWPIGVVILVRDWFRSSAPPGGG